MGERKILKSAEIPRQPRPKLNAHAIAKAEAAIAHAEAIILVIERVVTMAEEELRRYGVRPIFESFCHLFLLHPSLY
ncbi:hypothetical protein H5410_050473 [Solanum commersonii]|uniref:Uncharacterized protein n=1 Tax=Solanum commersonii TaxID=4109 RepID=A0A9J5WY12_SOLCO|nr:hypothetical protein H5410_050473 [Solanum commersonii]